MIMTAKDQWLRTSLVTIVVIHFIIVLWHGAAHGEIPVQLSSAQTAFVIIVITLLPVIGGGLLWSRRKIAAAWLITLSMLAALVFGVINHFMLESSDYVVEVPVNAWRHSFVLSAALVAVTEAIGTALGAVAIRMWRAV